VAAGDERETGDPLTRALALAGLVALVGWTFWSRWQVAAATPYPTGVDGYWYAVQLRSLLEGEGLYYPAAPLSLWLMAPLAAAAGPIAGAKLGAALAGAALPITTYMVGRRVSGERAGGLLAAALVASSAGSLYLGTEFVKNAVALPIGMGALAALGWALERPSPRRLALPAALAIATALSHLLVLGLLLVAGAAPVCLALYERGRARGAWLAAAALGLCAALLLASRPELVAGLVGPADWSLPALRVGGRALFLQREVALAGAIGLLALLSAALAPRLWALRPAAPRRDRALAWGPAAWAVAIALPWLAVGDPEGPVFRLRLMAFAPLAVAAPLCASALLARCSPAWRMTILMLVIGAALVRPRGYQAPVVRVHPDLAAAVEAARGRVPPGGVLITPERHIAFMAVWYTRVEARLRPEPVAPERRWRLIPMAYMSEHLARAIDEVREEQPVISLHRGHPLGLVLLPEATWRAVLSRLPLAERDHYRRWVTY